MSPGTQTQPEFEKQIRPLTSLPPEEQIAAWKLASHKYQLLKNVPQGTNSHFSLSNAMLALVVTFKIGG